MKEVALESKGQPSVLWGNPQRKIQLLVHPLEHRTASRGASVRVVGSVGGKQSFLSCPPPPGQHIVLPNSPVILSGLLILHLLHWHRRNSAKHDLGLGVRLLPAWGCWLKLSGSCSMRNILKLHPPLPPAGTGAKPCLVWSLPKTSYSCGFWV